MTELVFPALGRRPAGRAPMRGVLVRWLAADGSAVHVGDRLAEVRAAGGDVGWVRALATGTLWHQVRAGEVLSAGAVVGLID
ncbi:biotin attachment protein [Saccharopolyspora sp. NPDC000359]|uniref:biotin attachment protein n=1 Tax=Saccharopolyspora sp. NPDC000359 TaxID=3154251 RepID=UPI003324BE75